MVALKMSSIMEQHEARIAKLRSEKEEAEANVDALRRREIEMYDRMHRLDDQVLARKQAVNNAATLANDIRRKFDRASRRVREQEERLADKEYEITTMEKEGPLFGEALDAELSMVSTYLDQAKGINTPRPNRGIFTTDTSDDEEIYGDVKTENVVGSVEVNNNKVQAEWSKHQRADKEALRRDILLASQRGRLIVIDVCP